MSMHRVAVTVNGKLLSAEVESRLLLVHMIREVFRLTGTHIGCDTTHCGACTVLLDGKPVKSCTMLAVQADGRQLMTVEGLAQDGKLSPVQEGFTEKHGLQCGFCTPGFIVNAYALLQAHRSPDAETIKTWLDGNLCRCTGYEGIRRAIAAAKARQE